MGKALNFQTSYSPANTGMDTREKAAAFINISIPIQGGGSAKIGAIALRKGNADEAKLLEWLKGTDKIKVTADDGTECEMTPVELLQATLMVDFREVRTEAHRFALPGM